MATRIDKKIGGGFLNLENHLKRRAGRKFEGANYEGLLRKNALSDLTDSSVALTNVFNSLTKVSDQSEIKLYGEYSVNDWEVTGDFVSNQITKQFLQPLKNASSVGGILGSTVSTSPRIRIEDRINLIDSFYNRGSWPGLGSGCTAFFYGVPSGAVKELGFAKFQIGTDSSLSDITFYTNEEGTNITTLAAFCGEESSIVVDIISYKNPSTLEIISLAGAGISLKLIKSSSSTIVFNSSAANLLKSIKQILPAGAFANVKFKIGRPYSIKNPPRWYLDLPPKADSGDISSADDTNPAISFMVLNSSLGEFVPYSEKEYWFSGNYVETRWRGEERSFVGEGAGIVQDSNIRFSSPPRVLRDFNNNWGVRWDGYLVVYDSDINKYSFKIQTNSAIKIDICSEVDDGGGSGAPRWVKVFDSLDPNSSAVDQAAADTYYTKNTFVLNNLHGRFRHFLNVDKTKWIAYVPISIRFYAPAADKAYPAISIPTEPNFFIKLLSSTPAGSAELFHSGEIEVTVAASGTDWIITPSAQQTPDLSSILGLTASRANYSLIKKQTSVTRVTEAGAEETVLLFTQLSSPIQLTLLLDNTTIKATGASIGAGVFKLRIQPKVEGYLSSPFWKSLFISPSLSHKKYQDLIDGSFEPSIYKLSYSSKPQWWKVSEGFGYDVDFPVSKSNTPLDGFIKNDFKSQLSSNVQGVGKYGNGATPPAYSSRPNIILGEGAYPSGSLTENYIGIRLMPNLLGEGGKIKFTGIPLNNSESNDTRKLQANDLGGGILSKTAASGPKLVHRVVRLYWHLNAGGVGERYLLRETIPAAGAASDDPTAYGLSAFSEVSFWAAPVTVTATLSADDLALQTNPRTFVGPLTLNAEKITIDGVNLLAFNTSLKSILAGGSEFSNFNGKYIKIYNELYGSFQFTDVDTGESISYSDVLKLSYSVNTPIPSTSEVPKPPADRVTPFGYDDPKYTSGVCYPPYAIGDSLLSDIVATDIELPSEPPGNYDVFWGDHTLTDLGQKFLEITEKIEFSHNSNEPQNNIIQPISSKSLSDQDYTHRMKIEFPLPAGYDEDIFEHIGNQEKVKDVYYLFINAKSGAGFLPGL